MKKIASAVALTFGLTVVSVGAVQADEVPVGTSPENPILVGDPSEVPEGAVENEVSTYQTPAACDTTRSWVLTIPAEEEVNHDEVRLKREVSAVEEVSHQEWGVEKRTRTHTPAQEEVSHKEYRYKREVPKYKTRYQYQKQVKGVVDQRDNGQFDWHQTGQTFDWEWYINPSYKWSYDLVESLESGNHSSIQKQWTEGNGNKHWRWRTTRYRYFHNGVTEQVPDGTKTETTDWLTSPPEGDGWAVFDTRKVVDTPAVPESYGPWTEWKVTESGLLVEPTLPENTQVKEFRATGPVKVVTTEFIPGFTEFFTLLGSPFPILEELAEWVHEDAAPAEGWAEFDRRTVVDEESAPEQVIYYAWTDGKECDKPEGHEDVETTTECVDGDLVTTETVTTGTPVQNEEDGSWTIEETATSSQSVEKGAEECATEEPPTEEPPVEEPPTKGDPKPEPPVKDSPTPPATVPTAVNAGVGGDETTEPMAAVNLMAGVGVGLLVMSLIVLFISRSEELEE